MSISLKAGSDGTSGTIQINGIDKVTIDGNGISQGAPAGFRNLIINGGFGVNQRAVSDTVTLAAGAYGHDRWKAGASGCTYTFATSNGLTTLTITAGSLQQVVEDKNVPAGTNTMIMSWDGTAQGKIGAGSYGASGVTASVTGGSNLTVEFGTGTIANVQLEKGTVATPFEFRPYGTELALCQRYYQAVSSRIIGTTTSSGTSNIPWSFKVPMRSSPTVTLVGSTGATSDIGVDSINVFVANSTALIGVGTTASAEL